MPTSEEVCTRDSLDELCPQIAMMARGLGDAQAQVGGLMKMCHSNDGYRRLSILLHDLVEIEIAMVGLVRKLAEDYQGEFLPHGISILTNLQSDPAPPALCSEIGKRVAALTEAELLNESIHRAVNGSAQHPEHPA